MLRLPPGYFRREGKRAAGERTCRTFGHASAAARLYRMCVSSECGARGSRRQSPARTRCTPIAPTEIDNSASIMIQVCVMVSLPTAS